MKKINKSIVLGIFLVVTLLSFVVAVDNNQTTITKQEAFNRINESEKIMIEMQEKGFSVNYINDSLIEAKRVFQQAYYASILRGEINVSDFERSNARIGLSLVKWDNITYDKILFYLNEIENRKKMAFLLLDKITIEENKINSFSNEARAIFQDAKNSFLEERYNDAEKLLEDLNIQIEKDKTDISTLSGLKKGAMNFFQRYWIYILIILVILGFGGYHTYKKYEKKILRNKIIKMKTEEHVLNDLMKKTQTERFKENKISGLIYNIRMNKYQERLQEIKEELPVLEDNLKRLKNVKNFSK